MEYMLCSITLFGGDFAPKDWAFCRGQLMPISQNQGMFAIMGTIWGGDGRTTFALPDLRSRVPAGTGQGAGLLNYRAGMAIGQETHQLTISQMPNHSHGATFSGTGGSSSNPITATATVNSYDGNGDRDTPSDGYWANARLGRDMTSGGYSSTANSTMASEAVKISISGGGGGITGGTVTVNPNGGDSAFGILQPTLGVPYILCVQGFFPTRN